MSISQLLNSKDLTPQKLFSGKNVSSQIKNNIEKFVNYSLRHRDFIFECLRIVLNSSYSRIEQNKYESIAYNISQVLCCDDIIMAELFFEPQEQEQQNRSSAEVSQKIEQEQSDNIQSQAQRLFQRDESPSDLFQITNRSIEIEKNQLAKKSLQILKLTQINESSLGYLSKIWAFLIRNNSNQALQFFSTNQHEYNLLINNLKYSSISNLVAQLLIAEDRTKVYKYQKFKNQVFKQVIDSLMKNKQDQDLYEGVTILLEEVLSNSKQSYCQYFQDFMRSVSYLSSEQVLKDFYQIVLQRKQSSFKNSVRYLQSIFQRINSQKQDYRYQNRVQNNEPHMFFQIDFIVNQFQKLISLVQSIKSFTSITKINYLTLLLEIIKTSQFQDRKTAFNYSQIIEKIMNILKAEDSKGLVKIKLTKLIEEMIKISSNDQIEILTDKKQIFFQANLSFIQSVNIQNNRIYNKNQNVAFQCKILFEIDNKIPGHVQAASHHFSKNLKRIQKKYSAKIANFGKSLKSINSEEQGGFFNFNQISQGSGQNSFSFKQNKQNTAENNFVGKNSISIPVLNLPENMKITKPKPQRQDQLNKKSSLNLLDQISREKSQLTQNNIQQNCTKSIQVYLDKTKIIPQEKKVIERQNKQTNCKSNQKIDVRKNFFIRHELLIW